ncbi:hypothetical protein HK100_001244 [Physocladia obscura]|uniref:Uncharacterized protein n=1 Tax=Physocladia obscura TaxID=109957 RepID=A0AAD5TAC4_9FUNG|nr:hypothetical protein HK100_001244 [Physocladia obscura]
MIVKEITVAAVLAFLFSGRKVSAGTCVTYTGGYCTDYVNYPAYLSSGGSIAASEAVLKAGGIDLLLSLNASTPIDRPYSIDQVTCQTVCQNAVSECTTLFTAFGKTSIIPVCSGTVLSFNVSYSTTDDCLGYTATSTANWFIDFIHSDNNNNNNSYCHRSILSANVFDQSDI